jgi:GT2 family glycosyltransferase
MDVSIIIVNYNTCDLTLQCLTSVYEKTKDISFEVIVVDNNSSDNSVQCIKKFFSQVLLVENAENLGFGRANNLGYAYATGKYIFLLNSDTYLLNNAVKEFYDKAEEASSKVACLGIILLKPNGEIAYSFGDYLSIKEELKYIFVHFFYKKTWEDEYKLKKNDFPFKVQVVVGADLFIRRGVIEELGFFDPAFFMYHEENDLQRRYGKMGYEKIIIDGPCIVHLGKCSSKGISTHAILATQGSFTYLKKWEKRHFYYLYRFLYIMKHIFIMFKFSKTWEERKKRVLLCFFKVRNIK